MKKEKNVNVVSVVSGSLVALLLAGCAGTTGQTSVDSGSPEMKSLSCIAVLPVSPVFMTAGKPTQSQIENMDKGAKYLDTVLAKQLQTHAKVKFANDAQVTVGSRDTTQLRQVAASTGCEAVLVTEIVRYQQRVGGEAAVDMPASASFSFHLLHAASNRSIWNADFDETQESLLGNLLTFNKAEKRGFKWITVEEMVAQGATEQLEACPYLK